METHLRSGTIGAVVTACTSRGLSRFNNPDIEGNPKTDRPYNPKKCSGKQLIELMVSQGIPHHQSLLYEYYHSFEVALGINKDELIAMSDDEFQQKADAFYAEEAPKTLKFIDDFFTKNQGQKFMIHCAAGSDRSAMIAVAYMCQLQGDGFDIDLSLRHLNRIRPGAALDIEAFMFKDLLGSRFEEFSDTTQLYKNTVYSKAMVPSEESVLKYAAQKEGPELNCLKSYFDDTRRNADRPSRYFQFVTNCNRFGIAIPTWRI